MNIRGTTIKYASIKKKERDTTMKLLETKIDNLQEQLSTSEDNSIMQQIEKLQLDLEKIMKYKTQNQNPVFLVGLL